MFKFISAFCRQAATCGLCLIELSRLLCMQTTKSKIKTMCVIVAFTCLVLWLKFPGGPRQIGTFTQIELPKIKVDTTKNKNVFTFNPEHTMFLYSAIVNNHYPVSREVNIIVTGLNRDRLPGKCCVLMESLTMLFECPAEEYWIHRRPRFSELPVVRDIAWFFTDRLSKASQIACTLPYTGHHVTHVTLTSGQCPLEVKEYLPIQKPLKSSSTGTVAICSKIAHGNGLDPEKVIEWFEVMVRLGVSKVLMFYLGTPDPVRRVLQYYQDSGLLELLPYSQPGPPYNRSLSEKLKRSPQFSHDENMVVFECRQRLAEYTFVLGHDLDEMIIPRQDVTLPQFFKSLMETYQDAAGFYFLTEFFIYQWGASSPKEDMMITRYQRSTPVHQECTKYAYLPSRVHAADTHDFYQQRHYKDYWLPASQAILHHYRNCPADVWPTCEPETIIDDIMNRYKGITDRVMAARKATGIEPQWKT